MATKIKIKSSDVAGKAPAAGAIDTAELAVNLQDQKLYSKDSSGNVFELSGKVYSVNGEIGDVDLGIDDLNDVDASGVSNGQVLAYNLGEWKPVSPSSLAVSVDLDYVSATDKGTVTNSAGNNAEIPLANSTNAGLFQAAEKLKLAGIEDGAQVNVPGEVPSGDTAGRPGSPTLGDLYYDTDLDALIYWGGSSWVEVGSGAINPDDFVKLDDGGTKQVVKSAGLGLSNGTDENITLEPSGAGTFAGSVQSKTNFVATTSGASGGLTISTTDDGSKDSVNNINRDINGLHFVSDRTGSLADAERKIDFALGSSTPSITFNSAGGAQFSADVKTDGGLIAGGDPTNGANIGTQANWSGIIRATRSAGNMFEGYVLGSSLATAQINVTGDCIFLGEMKTNGYYTERYLNTYQRKIGMGFPATIGGSVEEYAFVLSDPAAQKLYFGVDLNGNGEFDGRVTADNVTVYGDVNTEGDFVTENGSGGSYLRIGETITFHLEPDNPDNYKMITEEYEDTIRVPIIGGVGTADLEAKRFEEKTVTRTREVQTYVGPALDVKEQLQALIERAAQQDAVIEQMTAALRELGKEVTATPSVAEERPATSKRSRKKKAD